MNTKQPRFVRTAHPLRYPRVAQEVGVGDTLVADFVVDSTGHVEPQTFHYVRGTYREFAEEAKRSILAAVYEPGTVGGCPVSMMVEQPVHFQIAR